MKLFEPGEVETSRPENTAAWSSRFHERQDLGRGPTFSGLVASYGSLSVCGSRESKGKTKNKSSYTKLEWEIFSGATMRIGRF
jgi:hypothetical protein